MFQIGPHNVTLKVSCAAGSFEGTVFTEVVELVSVMICIKYNTKTLKLSGIGLGLLVVITIHKFELQPGKPLYLSPIVFYKT